MTGERILPTPVQDIQRAGEATTIPGFPWWILILLGVTLAAAVYVALAGRTSRSSPMRRQEPAEAAEASPRPPHTP